MRRNLDRAALAALIALLGVSAAGPAVAQRNKMTIPANTVVRVKLDTAVDSRKARLDDRVIAVLSEEDRSQFPEGTQFEGRITEAKRATKSEPGIVAMEFTRALLPGGGAVAIDGHLASLGDEDAKRMSDGRLEARKKARAGSSGGGGKFDLKWVGYGAGAGAVLGTILGGATLKGALLGGLGGAVYGYLNKGNGGGADNKNVDVQLKEGTEFGIRMDSPVAFTDNGRYRFQSQLYQDERVAGTREAFNFRTATAMVNGQRVTFADDQPMNLNGQLYVPLRAIADAAKLRFDHYAGEENFTLGTPNGRIRAMTSEAAFTDASGQRVELDNDPVLVDGEVYVSTDFLNRAAGLQANWDRRNRELTIDSRVAAAVR